METKMKITKSILAQIIKEEIEELQQEGVLDTLRGGKAALQKKFRAVTGGQRAAGAGKLAAAEVDVAAALEEIHALLEKPGNQAAGVVKNLVRILLDRVKGQVKDSPPKTTDPATATAATAAGAKV
jgi:hypothetical protein